MEKNREHFKFEKKVLYLLDLSIHILIFLLIIALFVTIIYELFSIFFVNIPRADIHTIVDSILFALILVELFTILYTYLKKHFIKLTRVIEVGIISIVREIIFKIFDIPTVKIYSLSALLFVLGAIYFIARYLSMKDESSR